MIDFTILDDFEDKLKLIEASFKTGLKESIDKNKPVIKQIQTDLQMFQGKDAQGLDIRPFYAPSTIRYKQRNNQPFDRVTLKDTGAFYQTIEVEARDDDFKISSQIEYSIFLVQKYGAILGVTADNMRDFIERYTLPEIKKLIDDIITES